MIFRRKRVPTERVPLSDEERKFLSDLVDVPNPLAEAYPPEMSMFFPSTKQARFFTLQCPHCLGVHTGRCPAVKALKLFESQAIREVVFYADGEFDDTGTIRFEDVFGAEEASGEVTT